MVFIKVTLNENLVLYLTLAMLLIKQQVPVPEHNTDDSFSNPISFESWNYETRFIMKSKQNKLARNN